MVLRESRIARLWSRLPLAAKIVLPYLLLTLLVGAGGTFVATRLAARSANDRLTTALVEALRTADSEMLTREQARLAALDELLDRAAEGADPANVVRLDTLPEQVDWAASVSPTGEVVSWLRREPTSVGSASRAAAPALAAVPAVRAVLDGRRDAIGDRHGGLAHADGLAALVAVAPRYPADRSGSTRPAALVVGTDLAALAADLKRETLTEFVLAGPDGRALATTLGIEGAFVPVGPADDELRPSEIEVEGRKYRLLVAPLRARGQTIGVLASGLPAEAVSRVGTETSTQLALLFGGAMVLAVLVGLAIARLIARPVGALAEVARSVGAGDLARRSQLRGPDEIGRLGEAFDAMAASLEQREVQLTHANVNTMRSLAAAVDAKDPYTHGHSQRVSTYATLVARELGLEEKVVAEIEMGGLLHDVGKIGVPDGVLSKPGRLDEEEWAAIRKHPTIGAEILRPVGFSRTVMDVVLYHHERLNGRGFPDGLRADQIPLAARIAAVCDAYDAMTSDRSYRPSLGHSGAIEELRRGADDQFDRSCVEALLAVLARRAPIEEASAALAP